MPDLHRTKEKGSVDRVAYEAAIAQRNRYREAHARLEHQVESLKTERDALREALALIADPPRADWMPGEYPLVINKMREVARAALERPE